jgi:N-sulfoglucosamine sulfohydrolase
MGNLADNSRYRARFRRLKKELAAWMKQQGDKGAQTEAEALERKAKSRSK